MKLKESNLPCYEVNLISVDLKIANTDTLLAALKALGLTYIVEDDGIEIKTPAGNITLSDGKAVFSEESCQAWVNKIKQAYSIKTIEQIAKKYKFTISAKPGNKMTLRRY